MHSISLKSIGWALVAASALCGLVISIPSLAAVRKPLPPATVSKPTTSDGQPSSADLLKKLNDIEARVTQLETDERGENPKAQILVPPAPPNKVAIPPTLQEQLTSLTNDVKALQSQVATLESKVAADELKYESEITNVANMLRALTSQVDAGGSALQTLQKQFAGHTHTLTTPLSSLQDGSMGLETILHCNGFGQPCTSATTRGDITTLLVTGPPQKTGYATETTSGPIVH